MDRAFHNEGLVGGNDVQRWIDQCRPPFHGTVFGDAVPLTRNLDFAATQQAMGSWFLFKGDLEEVLVGNDYSWGAISETMSQN
eukprot:9356966-Alexandrium_andersonii.AAC.1